MQISTARYRLPLYFYGISYYYLFAAANNLGVIARVTVTHLQATLAQRYDKAGASVQPIVNNFADYDCVA